LFSPRFPSMKCDTNSLMSEHAVLGEIWRICSHLTSDSHLKPPPGSIVWHHWCSGHSTRLESERNGSIPLASKVSKQTCLKSRLHGIDAHLWQSFFYCSQGGYVSNAICEHDVH
jgi:hypothetical protein